MSIPAWAIAAAFMHLDDAAIHYKTLDILIRSTKLSRLGWKGDSPSQTIGSALRKKKINKILVFQENGRGYYQLGYPDLVLQRKEVKEAIQKIKFMRNQEEIYSFEEEHGISVLEGTKITRYGSYHERKAGLRLKAIEIHGLTCKVCEFNFENRYGTHGKNFIEVHHLKPLSENPEGQMVNPETDMTVLCSNCHRMIHRKKDRVLSIVELKKLFESQLHARSKNAKR